MAKKETKAKASKLRKSAPKSAGKIDTFFADLAAYRDWVQSSALKDIALLGDATEAAVNAIKAVRAKVEDYFVRERLAAYDARAIPALNRSEADYLAVAGKELAAAAPEVGSFPLARIEPGRPLPLVQGVNPAWSAALAALRAGVVIEGKRTLPAGADRFPAGEALPPRDPPIRERKSIPVTWLRLILTEGRNRQVRKMTAAVGHPTLRLIRYAIGEFTLEGLPPGSWREVGPAEIARKIPTFPVRSRP